MERPIERAASFSRDRRYRYDLRRRWDEGPALTWVMLNPSMADERRDDPTIRRCIAFSRAWGFGALRVVNLFALRTPTPCALLEAADVLGPGGERALRSALRSADAVVVAWGNVHPRLSGRAEEVRRLLPAEAMCLGVTGRGEPRHPLYVAGGTEPATLSVFGAAPTMAA